jgi:PAS domain S-box-containing protein
MVGFADQLFAGTGEMRARCRDLDWSRTALGGVETWSERLRAVAQLVLAHPFPNIVLWGPELVQIYNDGYRELMRSKHPAGLGQPTRECWPEVWHITGPIYERVRLGESLSFEDALYPLTRSGVLEDAWFTLSYSPLRDESDAVAGVLVTVLETTARLRLDQARRRAEAELLALNARALRETADRLELALSAANMGTFVWYPDGDHVESDARMLALFGQAEDGVLSLRTALGSLIHPDDAARYHDAVMKALEPGGDGRLQDDIRIVLPEGERWIAVRARSYFENGKALRMAGATLDITERKRAEAARAESEAALAAELASSRTLQQVSTELISELEPVAVYATLLDAAMRLMRADGASIQALEPGSSHERLKLLASRNLHARSAEHWLWVTAESATTCGQALHTRRRSMISDVERDLHIVRSRDLLEYRRSGVRGAQSTPLISRSGQLLGMISTYWRKVHHPSERELDLLDVLARQAADLMERASSESQRERLLAEATIARAQAEAANRANDEFLATLSHELRTPLAAILLWAGTLRSGTVSARDLARAVDAIVQSAESQSRLIEDLLDLSRLTSGKLVLWRSEVDVAEVARAAVEMVKPMAAGKRLALSARIPDDLGSALLDGTRFKQILWNLLTNATKFTPEQGRVTLSLQQRDGCLEIEVEDSGEGIAPAFMPHLFEKFRQADMGETRQHMGLGIGLALTRQLVELHGGQIQAESHGPGRGAVFRVRLPWPRAEGALAKSAATDVPASRPSEPPALAGLHVLLVEDDGSTREAMRWTLAHSGALVDAVATAEQALSALSGADPAVVIVSDLGLPGVSGYELIERVVADYRRQGRRAPPSCAISAHARDVDRQRAIDAGFDLYIAKPVTPERLIEAVRDLGDVYTTHVVD